MDEKRICKKNEALITISVLLILEVAVAFGLLWLFERGIWMVVCQLIHAACLSIYFMWCLLPSEHEAKKPFHDNDATAITFGSLMGIPIYAMFLLPIWLYDGEDFLMKYNHIFGTDYTTTYEGGLASIFITCIVGLPLAIAILCPLYHTIAFAFGKNKKAALKGLLYAALVYIGVYVFYKERMDGYDPAQDQRTYETQMRKEEFDIDQKLESDKKRVIQRDVNNYGKSK